MLGAVQMGTGGEWDVGEQGGEGGGKNGGEGWWHGVRQEGWYRGGPGEAGARTATACTAASSVATTPAGRIAHKLEGNGANGV